MEVDGYEHTAPEHHPTQWNSAMEAVLITHFPVHRACRDGDNDALEHLLASHDRRTVGSCLAEDQFYGWTPAHWAAYFGKLECLQTLLFHCWSQRWLDCDLCSSRFSQTPLHLAAYGGSVQCVKWLLESGCSALVKDYLGETAAHKAARSGSIECLGLLLAKGAPLSEQNQEGRTPADVAEGCGRVNCAKYLRHSMQLQTAGRFPPFAPPHQEQGQPVLGAYGFQPMFVPPPTSSGMMETCIPDVLLDPGVCDNRVPVAGRKRARAQAFDDSSPAKLAKKCRLLNSGSSEEFISFSNLFQCHV